ncbi:hypothetical protein [Kamptonema sp. UHCC 0994]|uniref:hypothetical protein n=1 Tax=Kamptonema sp. UHCC 0994 TaxID=3031329 RepID=UPI0023BAE37B|nr:hypothetical protein [Kamptonema sp. UHCC 0994]MDF0556364.1 hypothetical protein [Kamptonema sp. UHCC 0994]
MCESLVVRVGIVATNRHDRCASPAPAPVTIADTLSPVAIAPKPKQITRLLS